MSLIFTPDHPDFYFILHSKLPPGSTAMAYAPDTDTGIFKPMTDSEEADFIHGNREVFSEDYLIDDEWHSLI
ncbi:hypothetical protein [Crocosphaera sp.]|uniref:hypothetical protein n=1 Tax=Crocosphaera sp. TaxID=2729996 RepID=UPI003F29C22A|nr:hypothetical protein [Crocosphaera sp.]